MRMIPSQNHLDEQHQFKGNLRTIPATILPTKLEEGLLSWLENYYGVDAQESK